MIYPKERYVLNTFRGMPVWFKLFMPLFLALGLSPISMFVNQFIDISFFAILAWFVATCLCIIEIFTRIVD